MNKVNHAVDMEATVERISHYRFSPLLLSSGVITLLVLPLFASAAAQTRPQPPSPSPTTSRPSLPTPHTLPTPPSSPLPPQPPPPSATCPDVVNYIDSAYGKNVRQLARSAGQEHKFYYWRDAFNADNSPMIVIPQNTLSSTFEVTLYTGDGCFVKTLFAASQYNWRVAWDRNDPAILYTTTWSGLYKYNVNTNTATLLKSFESLGGFKPIGPSLNQAGDRIFVITFDGSARTYRLPDMKEERAFSISSLLSANGCLTDWEDIRYTGYLNYVAVNCWDSPKTPTTEKLAVVEDTGIVLHVFSGPYGKSGFSGHWDFSPNGKLAYFRDSGGGTPLEIHVVNIDGTNDQILYSVPQSEALYVQNLHISWPDSVTEWFIVSFFPSVQNLPTTYAPPLDEILLISSASGKYKFLARTHTKIGTRQTGFWAQPLASPSADGSRISFNSNSSGTIDQYILWVPMPPFP